MARAARLQTDLVAKDVSLSRTLKRADRSLRSFDKRMNKISRNLRGVGALIGLTFGAQAVKNQLNYADSIGKTARQLGTTTEFLSEAAGAAQLAGVETRALLTGLQRLTRRASEAADGTGAAADAFKELGLNAQELERQSLDKQLTAVLNALAGVENEADRVRLAMKFFDTEGVKIARLAGNFDELQETVRAAGGTITTEFSDSAAVINDKFSLAIQRFNSYLRSTVVLTYQAAAGIKAMALNMLGLDKTSPLAKEIDAAQKKVDDLARAIRRAQAPGPKSRDSNIAQLNEQLAEAEQRLATIKNREQELIALYNSQDQVPVINIPGLTGLETGEKLGADIAAGVTSQQDEIDAAIEEAFSEAKADALRDRITGSLDDLDAEFDEVGERGAAAFNRLDSIADQAARNMQDAFADFLFDPFQDGVRGMLRSFIDTLRRMAAEAAAVRVFSTPFVQGLVGAVTGGVTGGGGSSVVSAPAGKLAAVGAGKAITIVNNNDFTGADSGLVAAMPALLDQNKQQTKAEIIREMKQRRVGL